MRRCLAVAAVAVAAGALAPAEARADVYGTSFRSPPWHVEMTVPNEWELSDRTSYPGIIAYAVHAGGGRITLAAEHVAPEETARAYAERNLVALRDKVRWTVAAPTPHPSGAYTFEAVSRDRRRKIKQAYLVHDGIAYVLTMAAPVEEMRRYERRPFEDTLRSIVFPAPAATSSPWDFFADEPESQPAAATAGPGAQGK